MQDINEKKRPSFHNIKTWFLTGLLVSLPITITLYITVSIINFFDDLIIKNLFPKSLAASIPGLGIMTSLVCVVIIGFVASNFLGKYFILLSDKILSKIPVIRNIYSTTKQIFDTLLANNSKAFKEVVLVEYPRKEMWVLAFVTSEVKGEIQRYTDKNVVSIFVPTTPNPTSGFLLFVPTTDLIKLSMTPEVAMKLIISGGMINSIDPIEQLEKVENVEPKETLPQ